MTELTLQQVAEATEPFRFTHQQAFDLVVEHAHGMDEPSMLWGIDTDTCAYRGEGGRKCFIGALIPDDLYEERFDAEEGGHSVETLVEEGLVRGVSVGLLKDMQDVHDFSIQSAWGIRLRQVAARWRLGTTKLDELYAGRTYA
jgi:hypothetical protein